MKNKINKNYGLNLAKEKQERQPEDWLGSGGITPDELLIKGDRKQYLPIGEVQKAKQDMMDCASRGPANIGETKLSYGVRKNIFSQITIDWFDKNKFLDKDGNVVLADANIAINSGTTMNGNSMKAPMHAIHEIGIAPKALLPLEPWMYWKDYHNPKRLTKKIKQIEKESLEIFDFNYERIEVNVFDKMIEKDLFAVAGYAWPSPINGEYPRSLLNINHLFVYFEKPPYEIFDNYVDSFDGDFIKNLASNYRFLHYGYRLIITEKNKKSLTTNNIPMELKDNYLYQEVEKSGAFGVAIGDKLMVGDISSLLATFIMRNKGDIKDKCIPVKEKDWEETDKVNPALQPV